LQRRERKDSRGSQKPLVPWDRLEIGFYNQRADILVWKDVEEEVFLYCEQMFLGKDRYSGEEGKTWQETET
jgi:hypothetical protein